MQAPESTCLVVMESSDYIPGSERRAGAIASSSVADHQMRIISIERHLRGICICGVLYILFYDLVLTSETPCYNGLTGVVKDLLAIDRAWRHRRFGCRVHLLVPGVSGARDKIIAGFVLMYGRKKHSVL